MANTHTPDSSKTFRDPTEWKTGDEPMTAAQRSYLETLAREAGEEFDPDIELTKAEAALRIEELQRSTGRTGSSAGKSYAGGFYTGGQPDDTPVQPRDPAQAQPPAAQSEAPRELAADDDIDPVVGQWYQRGDTQEKFVVADYDERAGTIAVQTAAGDLDELDLETWRSLPLVLAEQSQDWTEIIDNEPANDDVQPGPDEGARPEDEDDDGAPRRGS